VLLAIGIAAIYHYGPEASRNDDGGTRTLPRLTPSVEDFVNAFDGGDCLFVVPTVVNKNDAVLEGYGNKPDEPLTRLNEEFTRVFKFEATIVGRKVTPEQCPAVNFLWRMRNQRSPVPRLDIAATVVRSANPLTDTLSVKSGDYLTGAVAEFGNRNVDLLLVADDGKVDSLSDKLISQEYGKTFNAGLRRNNPGPPQPQLLLAVIAAKPLEALKPSQPGSRDLGPADKLFPKLLAEALQTLQSLNVSFKYFWLAE
jgi:serine/threonine-protein kinase